MGRFVSKIALETAVGRIYGTAGHLLKIWFTLKHMGLQSGKAPIEVDTGNSTPSLIRLFSCGAADGVFFVPFAHTTRYLTMKGDAARSIVQTTIRRWATSGSVVTCDPTDFLDIVEKDDRLFVSTRRNYPQGLGIDESGFARGEGFRVAIPLQSFAVWYGRTTDIPEEANAGTFLIERMLTDLNISDIERRLIFGEDVYEIALQSSALSDAEIFSVCQPFIAGGKPIVTEVHSESIIQYERKIKSMTSNLNLPVWMRTAPEAEARALLDGGAKAIVFVGPPRTGKTRMIDAIVPRNSPLRCTIQIHEGWGYDHLVEGFKPDEAGNWNWTPGPLKKAIMDGKTYIVLEEINRANISQSLGEVFSLIEEKYRGESNGITLRSGDRFWIPENVIFLMAMNSIDKSTEDLDDALLGRMALVDFPPRPEDMASLLSENHVSEMQTAKLLQLFGAILEIYPLGHGYFAGISGEISNQKVLSYYKSRVRPVLVNFMGKLRVEDLGQIDNLVDELFSTAA